MAKYCKKPIVIEAERWFKEGDHGGVGIISTKKSDDILGATYTCCGRPPHQHGWMKTLEGGHRVCPGDWIITGVQGEQYPCKPDIFDATYEAVDN